MRQHLCFMAPALLILACAEKPHVSEPGPGALPTYEQFRAAHPGRAFQATPERRANVLTGLSTVRPGMSRHQVASALGRPDWTQDLARKESPRVFGTEWAYVLSKPDLDLVNERNDQGVFVYFSTAGVVRDFRRMNIAEARPAERPAGT